MQGGQLYLSFLPEESPLPTQVSCPLPQLHLSFLFQLQSELEKVEGDNAELQEFANTILQQIADHCPDILEQVVSALEESS